jgi:hypothetical protein
MANLPESVPIIMAFEEIVRDVEPDVRENSYAYY